MSSFYYKDELGRELHFSNLLVLELRLILSYSCQAGTERKKNNEVLQLRAV